MCNADSRAPPIDYGFCLLCGRDWESEVSAEAAFLWRASLMILTQLMKGQ